MHNACAEEVLELQVKEEYYPEVDALIKRLTGASRIHIMQHALRRGKVEKRCGFTKQSKALAWDRLQHQIYSQDNLPCILSKQTLM